MPLFAPAGTKRENVLAPQGSHVARIINISHLGTLEKEIQGKKKMQDTVRVTFELCDEKQSFHEGEEPKPFVISKESTLSMFSLSFLRKLAEAVTQNSIPDEVAGSFDVTELLGGECLLNVKHTKLPNGDTISRVADVTPLPKGMEAPAVYNTPKFFDVNTATKEEVDGLPEFLRKKIYLTPEFATRFPDVVIPF